ncbi:MAG: tRNA glutamyl-Q(34) synthetase GluQRS [Gammaproteobacteria bacterium]
MRYRGRFAPSPTGPLHFGSLVAATGSYLDARHQHGEWLLRIEDLDPPREIAGASDNIIRTLEQLGMAWDGPISYQSQRSHVYKEALEQLRQLGSLYDCGCSRSEIADSAVVTATGPVYPGTCRNGLPPGRSPRSVRVRVDTAISRVQDRLQAPLQQQLATEVGDFIVRRADQLFSYQMAVVVDDGAQQINHVVRGADLLDSTPRQVYLQRLLGLPEPAYLHLPVAVDSQRAKLSKQTFAQAVIPDDRHSAIIAALRFLRQELPDSPHDASRDELWQWAIEHWDITAVPACRTLAAPADYIEPS